MKISDLDHPVMFAVLITMVVAAGLYLMGWAFSNAGWTGPQALVKGYGG